MSNAIAELILRSDRVTLKAGQKFSRNFPENFSSFTVWNGKIAHSVSIIENGGIGRSDITYAISKGEIRENSKCIHSFDGPFGYVEQNEIFNIDVDTGIVLSNLDFLKITSKHGTFLIVVDYNMPGTFNIELQELR